MEQNLSDISNPEEQNKNVKLCQSEDGRISELGDIGKLLKTHNVCLNTAGTSKVIGKKVSGLRYPKRKRNKISFDKPFISKIQEDPSFVPPQTTKYIDSLSQDKKTFNPKIKRNKIFDKPFTPKIQEDPSFVPPQTTKYIDSLSKAKKTYNHIARSYIENIYKIQTFLNLNPRAINTKEPNTDYITQKLQGYNRLIALPKTNPNLVRTCYSYGLLNIVYTYDGNELTAIPDLHKAFMIYKRVTGGNLFFIEFYPATAEILYDEIKPVIQVIKIGLTRGMIIPKDIGQQPEISIVEIPEFYANERARGIFTIIQELAHNFSKENPIWSYYTRDQVMIYSISRKLRQSDMEEVRKWIMTLLNPEMIPITRAIKNEFISKGLLTRYCKLVSQNYPDHICSKCSGEDNYVPDVQFE